jgi:MoaA/NifB/PqqE/SkfB family radical SAM enzyme
MELSKRLARCAAVAESALGEVIGLLRTPGRAANAALAHLQNRLGMTYLVGMPTTMAIEATNVCPGGCVLCPVGQGRTGRSQGHMDWDKFRRLIDQVAWHMRFISLYKWGEPLMHPRVYDMIAYIKSAGIYVRVSSNLHPFRAEDADRLIRSGLDEFVVSLHGISERTYRTYQPQHGLAEVLAKIQALMAAKRRLGAQKPLVRLNFVIRKDNEHEVPRLGEFSRALGIGFLPVELSLNIRFLGYNTDMTWRGLDEQSLARERLELMDRWLPGDQAYVNEGYRLMRRHGGMMPTGSRRLFRCTMPWLQMFVCWDGDVDVCAGVFDKKDAVGNVFEQSVRQVWNGPRYRAVRRCIVGRSRPGDRAVVCGHCPGVLL